MCAERASYVPGEGRSARLAARGARPGRARPAGRAARRALAQPQRNPHRAAGEAELLPQPPLDEPPVARLQEPGGEQHEVRRPDPRLGGEKNLRLAAAPHRRGGGGDHVGQPGVEPAGRHPRFPAGQRGFQGGHQPVHPPPGQRGDVHPRGPAGRVQLPVDLGVQPQPAVLPHQVPLVERDDQGTARVDHHGQDAQVLLGEGFAGVNEHDRHLGPLQRSRGAQGRVKVRALGTGQPPPDAGRVHEAPALAAQFDQLVHGVAGRPRGGVHEDPLLACEHVEEARLPHVGAADQRHPARAAGRLKGLARRRRQHVEERVEQIAAAAPVQRADRVRLPEAQRPQRRRGGLGGGVVNLVRRHHHRPGRLEQHTSDRFVGVGHANNRIHHEQHRVRGVHRQPGLRPHLLGEGAARVRGAWAAGRLPATGVHQREGAAAPGRVVGHPVAGDPGGVLHHRLAAAEYPVHQRRLADVRPPDDRDNGHRARCFPLRHGQIIRAGSARARGGSTPRSLASRVIRPVTWSRLSTVESTSMASAAIAVCGASARSLRLCSAVVTVAVAPGSAARSALRRWARASSLAVRNTLTAASGATTVPMSRPSATIPWPAAHTLAMISCCIATSRARTSETEATALTALDTSRVRIRPDTSAPSTLITVLSGSVPASITGRPAFADTTQRSAVSSPCAISHQVSARYIAPVSRYRSPSARATPRAALDLPAPAGPSTAITRQPVTLRCYRRTGHPAAESASVSRGTAAGLTVSSATPTGRPGECSIPTSSMLTPEAPATWKSLASSPGWSRMTTCTITSSRGGFPRLPGILATPARPSSSRPASGFSDAARSGPAAAAASASASAAADRSAAISASTRATGPAFAARICVHRPVSPAAILVTSRSPGPARASASAGAPASRAAAAAATTCGACETSATNRSWSAALSRTGSARQALASAVTAATAPGWLSSRGQITHGRPRNRSALAAAGPERSRPARGWPGTKAPRSHPSSRAAARGEHFTLATSVYQRARPAAWADSSAGATAAGGTASTARSARGAPPGARGPAPGSTVPAPKSAASRAEAWSSSVSQTATPRPRSASAMDVPISPVPITATLPSRGAGGGAPGFWCPVTGRCPAAGPRPRAGTRA